MAGIIKNNISGVVSTIPNVNSDAAINAQAAITSQSTPTSGTDAAALALANAMIAQMQSQRQTAASGRIYTRFVPNDDVLPLRKTIITEGLFSTDGTITTTFTSSLQSSSSKQYYYDVVDSSGVGQFAIAYGNDYGSGSLGTNGDTPSNAIYSQYRALLTDAGTSQFTFGPAGSTFTDDDIYVVNLNRASLKESLDPGTWQLALGNLSGSNGSNVVYSGSKVYTFTDDYTYVGKPSGYVNGTPYYNIVSGSKGSTTPYLSGGSPVYYGLVFPEMGAMVFSAAKLNASLSFNTITGSNVNGDNAYKFFTSVSGAIAANTTTNAFTARNEQTVSSVYYFVRVKNGEYNFSNNPTYTSGSYGDLAQPTFIGDPKAYITTVGLYNDYNELLAVAKLSQPIQKSFSNEVLLKVKLDF